MILCRIEEVSALILRAKGEAEGWAPNTALAASFACSPARLRPNGRPAIERCVATLDRDAGALQALNEAILTPI